MTAHRRHQRHDARKLILDADFDPLMIPESTVVELARHWTTQIGAWLGLQPEPSDGVSP